MAANPNASWGICPVCHVMKKLNRAGKLKRHSAPERGPAGDCSGSGQNPR